MITTLYLMPAQQCNCRCDYCYLPDEEKGKMGDADFFISVVERFILKASASNGREKPQLRFTGGEPYLEFDLVRNLSVRFLESIPDAMVVINTNGTLIDESDLAPMFKFRNNIHHVVSLDGTESIHNARRHYNNGGNGYQKVLSGIRALMELGFPTYINMVLDRISAEGLGEFMWFIRHSLGLDTLSVSLLHSDDFPISVGERFALLQSAYRTAKKYDITLTGHHRLLLGDKIPALRCRAGEKTVLVSSDRKLNACQRFVGKDDDVPDYGEDYDFEGASLSKSECCYTNEVKHLADKLYRLYEKEYPQYLGVNQVDRILFGTI